MVQQSNLEGRRTELEAEREGLRRQLEELGVTGDGSLSFDDGFADSGQVAAEQGETRVLSASLAEQLDEVERALAKLTEGGYGRCEVCGGDITAARLEAMPATPYCIEHASS
ncbi:MAG: TraR/DksA family transcriptional regulator [Acidimicrobiales bacterium]